MRTRLSYALCVASLLTFAGCSSDGAVVPTGSGATIDAAARSAHARHIDAVTPNCVQPLATQSETATPDQVCPSPFPILSSLPISFR